MAVWTWLYVQSLGITKLTILPVSGGTCLFYDTFSSNRDLLVDVGPTNSVRFITEPFLRAQGVNRLPTLLLTHGDVHHLGGTEPLIQAFGASCICSSPVKFRSGVCRKIMDRLSKSYVVEPIRRGQCLGDWTLLHPDEGDQFSRADDAAAVLRGTVQGIRILLLSDLGSDGQRTLLQRTNDLRADIVIAGLPAVGEPLCDALIAAIDPCLIIISDSEFPATERASAELRARLRRTKITTLYTRDTGAISLTCTHTWTLRAANGQPPLVADTCSRQRQLNVASEPVSE
jgi:beta-lactamase superfamily II metal-dependent hydrolase